jgi:hypothetical protein
LLLLPSLLLLLLPGAEYLQEHQQDQHSLPVKGAASRTQTNAIVSSM